MDPTAEELLDQTRTWRDRLDDALPSAEALTDTGTRFLENIRAYEADSHHFEEDGDPIRAFEAIVWAWAFLEVGAQADEIDWRYPEDGWPDAARREE